MLAGYQYYPGVIFQPEYIQAGFVSGDLVFIVEVPETLGLFAISPIFRIIAFDKILLTGQQDQIVQLKEQNAQLQEYIEALKAEIVSLKKLSPKPDIKPNTRPSDDNSGNDPDNQTSADSEGVESSGNSQDDSPE